METDLLALDLTELEVMEPTFHAIQALGLKDVRQLLATPARSFMTAAGHYESVQELKELLSNMGVDTSGQPFGQYVPPEARPPAPRGAVTIVKGGQPQFTVER